ncbi:MAG: tetratricopeptide repeat protein [Bacteroidota bacterium]
MKRPKKPHLQNGGRLPDWNFKIVKTGLVACFFFLIPLWSSATTLSAWKFDPELEAIYKDITNLRTEEAMSKLKKITDRSREHQRFYLQSLAECVTILVSEDEKRFPEFEKNFRDRVDRLEDEPESAETLFLRAEISLQRAFCHLNLSQEFSAILAFRQAYGLITECMEKHPDFIPAKKTSGVIQVMVGAVPDKYHWFMTLLGMKGSVKTGQRQLNELRNSATSLSVEAGILYFVIKGFINQQFDESAMGMAELLKKDPTNRLMLFITVNMMMKNSQSEEALKLIKTLDQQQNGLPVVYIEYLRAEIQMQKGDYAKAIQTYGRFMEAYKGSSFHKDATMKTALCYFLLGKSDLGVSWWEKAKKTGKALAEPDDYADHLLKEDIPENRILKVRFYTDGGYYKEAKQLLAAINPATLKTPKDRVEFQYRKARLAHKTGDLPAAQALYLKTIELTGSNTWYFAPSSALQLGYLKQLDGNKAEARKFFEMALTFRGHAYKNSIDSKAKSALDDLGAVKR